MTRFDYQSRQWKRFQYQQIEQANYRCQFPGCVTRRHLHAHHKIPVSLNPKFAFTPSNIEVLCPKHHAMMHGWKFVPPHWFSDETAANDDQFELDLRLPTTKQL